MPFQSQAQWRWAFATDQEFAHRWAKMTPGGKRRFALLAKRKRTTTKHLPGKHDQSAHGKPGRVGSAFRGAYSSATAGGATHREAWNQAKTAAEQVRQTMRDEKRADLAANPKPKRGDAPNIEPIKVAKIDNGIVSPSDALLSGAGDFEGVELGTHGVRVLSFDKQFKAQLPNGTTANPIIDTRTGDVYFSDGHAVPIGESVGNRAGLPVDEAQRVLTNLEQHTGRQLQFGRLTTKFNYFGSPTFANNADDIAFLTTPKKQGGAGGKLVENENVSRIYINDSKVYRNGDVVWYDIKTGYFGAGLRDKRNPGQVDRVINSLTPRLPSRIALDAAAMSFTPATKSTTIKHLPGKHDQSAHGRKGPAGSAGRAAYTAARSGGASHREALDAGKRASGEVRQAEQQQRNVNRAAQLRERANRLNPQPQATTTTTPVKPLAQQDGGLGLTGTPTKAYGVDPNTSYRMTHRIVEMDDLIPSNTRGGGVNPQYDAELQPRDRRRASSQAQIDKIARGLNPEVMTEDFKRIDAGSPIIDARGMVLSGNGRTLALQRQEDGSAYPGKQSEYRDEVLRVARDLGIDPADVAKMKNPIVVRQLEDGVDPVAFAREANSSGTLRMSPIEQARVDAEAMPQSTIAKLKSEEGQTLDAALRSPANKEFINAFLKVVPDNERASLLTADGELNPVGLYRAKAAVYTATFQSDSGDRMARSLLDSLDPDLASVQAGLSGALPQLSATVSTSRASNPALDPSNDIATAIDTLARIRGNPGLSGVPAKDKVQVYLEQSNMFNEGQKHNLSDGQVELLRHIDSIASRPARVRDFIQDIAKMVDAQPAEGQGGFFGGPLSLTEIYTSATRASQDRGKRTEEAKPKKPDESNTTAPSEPKPKLQLGDAVPKRSRGTKPKTDTTKSYANLVARLQRI